MSRLDVLFGDAVIQPRMAGRVKNVYGHGDERTLNVADDEFPTPDLVTVVAWIGSDGKPKKAVLV